MAQRELPRREICPQNTMMVSHTNGSTHLIKVLLNFSLTVKAAPHECEIRTSQP